MDVAYGITPEDLLYPKSKKYKSGYLDVGDGHKLYYYEFGNPDGPPVLLVHGGPGQGVEEGSNYTREHDPSFFRIIAIDQRGCGKSIPHFADTPKASLYKNDPQNLAEDLNKLRQHLDIEKWHLYGRSWGSCLSLLYATRYPRTVLSLTIGGIWLHTPREIDWYINYMGLFQPESEEKVLSLLPRTVKRFDRLPYLYKIITGADKKAALKLAEAQGVFEDVCAFFEPPALKTEDNRSAAEKREEKRMNISIGAIEVHFMKKHSLPDNWYKTPSSLKALRSIQDFHIFQGRYDIICPPVTAYELHKLCPQSHLSLVQYAGHTAREINLLAASMRANERLKKQAATL